MNYAFCSLRFKYFALVYYIFINKKEIWFKKPKCILTFKQYFIGTVLEDNCYLLMIILYCVSLLVLIVTAELTFFRKKKYVIQVPI